MTEHVVAVGQRRKFAGDRSRLSGPHFLVSKKSKILYFLTPFDFLTIRNSRIKSFILFKDKQLRHFK